MLSCPSKFVLMDAEDDKKKQRSEMNSNKLQGQRANGCEQ